MDRDAADLLIKFEAAMHAEGIIGRTIWAVIGRVIHDDPSPAEPSPWEAEPQRVERLRRCLAQAQAHERGLDALYHELRAAGEAYAWCAAQQARDEAGKLVEQLREDLGDKDPDLIVGEVVDGPASTPGDAVSGCQRARESAVVTLRDLQAAVDPGASPLDAALYRTAGLVAEQLGSPTPFDGRGILAYDMVLLARPEPSVGKDGRCYVASFGPVHYRGCDCKR